MCSLVRVIGQTEEVNASVENHGTNSKTGKDSLFDRIIGSAYETGFFYKKTSGLVDTGSMITSVSDSFFKSMKSRPELHNINEFGFTVQSANGDILPYKGYIEAEISVSFLSNSTFNKPLLVVSDTEYNSKVPSVVGKNVIRFCENQVSSSQVPVEWQTAFGSICDHSTPVQKHP